MLVGFVWGYILPKLSEFGLSSMKLQTWFTLRLYCVVNNHVPWSKSRSNFIYIVYFNINSYLINSSAVALNFHKSLAGKSLTSLMFYCTELYAMGNRIMY